MRRPLVVVGAPALPPPSPPPPRPGTMPLPASLTIPAAPPASSTFLPTASFRPPPILSPISSIGFAPSLSPRRTNRPALRAAIGASAARPAPAARPVVPDRRPFDAFLALREADLAASRATRPTAVPIASPLSRDIPTSVLSPRLTYHWLSTGKRVSRRCRLGYCRAFPTCSALRRLEFTSSASRASCLPASPRLCASPSAPRPVPGMGMPSTFFRRLDCIWPSTTPAAVPSATDATGTTAPFSRDRPLPLRLDPDVALGDVPLPEDCREDVREPVARLV